MAVSKTTQAQAAKHLGMSVNRLKQVLLQLNMPTRGFDLDELRLNYIIGLRKTASGRSREYDLTQERARLAHWQATKAEKECAVMDGELIPADIIGEEWGSMISAWRARARAIPSTVAPQVAIEKVVPKIHAMLLEAIDDALQEMADHDPNELAELTRKKYSR
ncbi:MAG: hypothetical protein AAF542_18120 [Pseudomonadota bacterium]